MDSKKTTRKKNFYLAVLKHLERSTNLKDLQKDLDISKQRLNYYLRELKKKGFIYSKGHGWYELTTKGKNPTKYGIFLRKDTSRGHAYVWNIELPKEIEGWDKRIEIIQKKGMNHKLVGALKTTPRIKALGRKVWLCNDHLRVYDKEKASYYGETAIESKKNAFLELLKIVKVLENKLGFYLRPFIWHVQKEHYALIKNDLAIDQNRKGVIMRIKDEEGEWLLIDDSLEQGGELETIGKKALPNNIRLQKWWNEQKETNFKVTPKLIMDNFSDIRKMMKESSETEMQLSQVLQQMEKNVIHLTKIVGENLTK